MVHVCVVCVVHGFFECMIHVYVCCMCGACVYVVCLMHVMQNECVCVVHVIH